MALGAVLAAAVLIVFSGPLRRAAIILGIAGLVILPLAAMSSLDRWPYSFLRVRLKPLSGEVVEAAAYGGAALAGLAFAAAILVGVGYLVRRRPITATLAMLATLGVLMVAGLAALWLLLEYRDDPRHPKAARRQLTEATLIAGNLDIPTGLALAPGGEIFFTELESGRIGVIPPGGGTDAVREFAKVPGLLFHVVLHPGWPAMPYVYVAGLYEVDGKDYARILRFTSESLVGRNPTPVIERVAVVTRYSHYASAMTFCGGFFFVSSGSGDPLFGDADDSRLAQSPLSGEGKILRYRLDGADLVPAGVLNADPPVYAMGFRNVFGMTCDEATGQPFVVDNGPKGHDQVRAVPPGTNHEWPYNAQRRSLTPPVFDSGIVHLAPTSVGLRQSLSGREILVGAYRAEALYSLAWDGQGRASSITLRHEAPSGVLALVLDPKGCLYFTDTSGIWRLKEEGCP